MLVNIILYLIEIIKYLYQQNCWLINFICKYIPLKQWAFDDTHSPKYQKLKVDELPKIIYRKQDWQWQDLIKYYELRYNRLLSLSIIVPNLTFLKTAVVLYVMQLPSSSIKITERKDNSYEKYVKIYFLLTRIVSVKRSR